MILMLIKYQFLKKNDMAKIIHYKYFIGYNDNDVIRPLCLRLSQMTGYIRKIKENKSKKNKFKENIKMSLRIKDKQLFKNYNKIWEKKLQD